jgi:hypothetical protein
MQAVLNNMSAARAAAIMTRKDLITIDRNDPFAIKEQLENTTQRLSLIDDAIAQFRSLLKEFKEAASEASDPGEEEEDEEDEDEEDEYDISSVESDDEESDEEDEYDISSVESEDEDEDEDDISSDEESRLADATAEESAEE